jgi:hypothetical protein
MCRYFIGGPESQSFKFRLYDTPGVDFVSKCCRIKMEFLEEEAAGEVGERG